MEELKEKLRIKAKERLSENRLKAHNRSRKLNEDQMLAKTVTDEWLELIEHNPVSETDFDYTELLNSVREELLREFPEERFLEEQINEFESSQQTTATAEWTCSDCSKTFNCCECDFSNVVNLNQEDSPMEH